VGQAVGGSFENHWSSLLLNVGGDVGFGVGAITKYVGTCVGACDGVGVGRGVSGP